MLQDHKATQVRSTFRTLLIQQPIATFTAANHGADPIRAWCMTSTQLIFHLAAEVLEHRQTLAKQLHTIIALHGASEPELAVRILAVYRVDMARDGGAFTDIYEFDGKTTQLSPDELDHHRIFVFDVEKDISHALRMPLDHVGLRLDAPLNFDLCVVRLLRRTDHQARPLRRGRPGAARLHRHGPRRTWASGGRSASTMM